MIREKNLLIEGKHGKPIVTDVCFKPNQQPKPIVVFCHGYKGFKDWGAWNLVAERFAEEGFFFIKFNFSHNGGTPEQPIDFPDLQAFAQDNYTKQLDDLQSVIDWISTTKQFHSNADVKQLNLIGHSRGGGVTAIKAAEEKKVKSLITWNGVSDFGSRFPEGEKLEQWKKEEYYYVENGRTKQKMPHHIQFYEDYQAHKNRLSIESAVKNITIPFLIIHAEGDTFVEVKEAKKLESFNTKNKLFLIKESNHVFNTKHPWENEKLSSDLNQVVEKTISFIKNQ
jgi:dienelactone hydrolase